MMQIGNSFDEAFDAIPDDPIHIEPGDVVIICLCYNEMLRLPDFLRHHRELGIAKFFFVDNGSTDGSYEYLLDQEDVCVFRSTKQYKEYKAIWRKLIADRYAVGHWVLFADVDELFVYPGWPELDVEDLTQHLQKTGADAMFCTMVDMYSDKPIGQHPYKQGTSMLEHCPYFDGDGYWRLAVPLKDLKRFPTPPFHVYGGARMRLLRLDQRRYALQRLGQLIVSKAFPIQSSLQPTGIWLRLYHVIFRQLKALIPSNPEVMSKVPLLIWDEKCEFREGVHSLRAEKQLSSEWGALLHFKYLDDLYLKVAENIARGQHSRGSYFYQKYEQRIGKLTSIKPKYKQSKDARHLENLINVGLMRASKILDLS